MKTAVIVSTYNRPDALIRVLDGLMHQVRLPDEIIIADDGSGNETRNLIDAYLKKSTIEIRHVWQEDKGFRLAEIRNKAILSSDADYMIFLDGDCIPGKYFVDDHVHLAQKGFYFQGKRVIVNEKASILFDYKDTCSVWRLMKHALVSNISNSHHIFRIRIFPSYTQSKLSGVRGCNMGFFRDDLIAVNGFNQAFVGWGREDSEIVVRLFKYGIKRKENPFKAICFHLWHEENARQTIDQNDKLLENAIESGSYRCKEGIKNYKHEN